MDLKTFVAESITQIAEGIKEAQLNNPDTTISPHVYISDDGNPHFAGGMIVNQPLMISFDIAVAASENNIKKGGGKISIFSASIGAEGGAENANSATSRIRFNIPVVWPAIKK